MNDIVFNEAQLEAINRCVDLSRRVVAVSGEAGTGKTTIMKEAVKQLEAMKRKIVLAAPTGKAARRISQATGYPAMTVHKLLEYNKPEIDEDTGKPKHQTGPSRHKDKPLDYTDVLVDEYAMVNEELHSNILNALPPGGRILAFGDVHQLPPIEPYQYNKSVDPLSPFQRLLDDKNAAVVLDGVFRQNEDSGILANARNIRRGTGMIRNKYADFDIRTSEAPLRTIREFLAETPDDFSAVENQIITPGRKRELGCIALSEVIQTHYTRKLGMDPSAIEWLTLPRDKWEEENGIRCRIRVGDKVICTENLYDLRDFFERFGAIKDDGEPDWSTFIPIPDSMTMLNGEIGIVEELLGDGGFIIRLEDRRVVMPSSFRELHPKSKDLFTRDPRKKIELAYAVTTHKMQGSECKHVLYLMHRSLYYNINRNNIYTAVTRAKQKVTVITDSNMLLNGHKETAQQKSKRLNSYKDK